MKILATFLVVTFAAFSSASACDLKNWTFGDSSGDVVSKYNIVNASEVSKKGSDAIVLRGVKVCSSLPIQAVAELAFINNKFVQLKISIPGNVGGLMDYAQRTFGDSDQGKIHNDTKNGSKFFSWSEKNNKIVTYSVDDAFEYLEITSTMHKNLFDKMTKEENK